MHIQNLYKSFHVRWSFYAGNLPDVLTEAFFYPRESVVQIPRPKAYFSVVEMIELLKKWLFKSFSSQCDRIVQNCPCVGVVRSFTAIVYSVFWVYLVCSQWDNCCADWVTKAPPSSIPKIASHIFFFSWFWVVTLLEPMVKVSIYYTFIDYNSDHSPPPLISPESTTTLDEGQRWIGKYLKIVMQ